MKALVTGGSGFIGSEVVRQLLEKGEDVTIFSRRKDPPPEFSGKINIYEGDLGKPQTLVDSLRNMDVLFHIGEIKNRTKSDAEKNVSLVRQILEHVEETGLKRIVYVSSISVSGIPEKTPADEDTPSRITLSDHYTDSKRRCEGLLTNQKDVEYVIIRPAPVYGPGSRYLGGMIRFLERLGPIGIPFPGAANNLMPLIHVRDLAKAICSAGTEPSAKGMIFNLTDGQSHSWREFLDKIMTALGKKIRIIQIPLPLLYFAALPIELVAPFFGVSIDPTNYVTFFTSDLYFSNDRAKKFLDWQPSHMSDQIVREMVESYKNK